MTAIEAAELAGIDLSLVEENLRLTPEQRALKHDEGLALVLQLEEAGYEFGDPDRISILNDHRTGVLRIL